jgi:predicted GNAT family N-acyltransferase
MITSYTNNLPLFERCIQLIDEVFPGCKEFALNGIKHRAFWYKASTPFIIEENGEIIAHAGIWPITFLLNGKEHHSASIHGVCVKASQRGKGHFQQLMLEVMQYAADNFESSILFTTKPYLYQHYPYQVRLPEYDFIVSDKIQPHLQSPNSDLRILQWDNANDLDIMHNLLSRRIPLSQQLSIIHENGSALFILNMLQKNIYYSERLNLMIVYDIIDNTLYLKEIISEIQYSLTDIIGLIPKTETTHYNKIVAQFCPDQFLEEIDYSPILARPECCVMTSDTFSFDNTYFRYPELYWC